MLRLRNLLTHSHIQKGRHPKIFRISAFTQPSVYSVYLSLLSVGDAEGEHGEVVVLLGAVAELVGVGLEGLDDVAHT